MLFFPNNFPIPCIHYLFSQRFLHLLKSKSNCRRSKIMFYNLKAETFTGKNFREEKNSRNLNAKFLLKLSETNFRAYRNNCELCRKNFRKQEMKKTGTKVRKDGILHLISNYKFSIKSNAFLSSSVKEEKKREKITGL